MLIESLSGIRGIFNQSLTEDIAFKYALSYYSFLSKKLKKKILTIVIGTDTRNSRNVLKNSVMKALNCLIIDVGIATTPSIELGVRHFKADGGIIITASHNEPFWNGFKFLSNNGAVLKNEEMQKIIMGFHKIKKLTEEQLTQSPSFGKNLKFKKIIKKYKEINDIYEKYLLGFFTKTEKKIIANSKIKIIIDPNGGTGIIAKKILEKIGANIIGINMNPGIFNRVVEPKLESLLYLCDLIKKEKAMFASAFDCDADRVQLLMPNCKIVSGNYLLAIIADDILSKMSNKQAVVVNDATSNLVKDVVNSHNSKIVETEVGEINVVSEMEKRNSPIGGEGSSAGVIISPSKCRDGILTLIHIIKILSLKKLTLGELINQYPQYYTLENSITIKKNLKRIKKELKDYYKKKGFMIIEKSKDGSLKIITGKNSFVWFRASKTEPNLLRIISDSDSLTESDALMNKAMDLLLNQKK